jgi:Ca2+-binding RTX toxin-like protein
MMIENVENRRLFAVTATLDAGVLTIADDGAGGRDLIEVHLSEDGANYVVRTATASTTSTTTTTTTTTTSSVRSRSAFGLRGGDFGTVTETTFAFADVTSISVDAGAGNDVVKIGDGVTIAATINGGDGNDELSGGAGADTINGGAGNDRLNGGAGRDVLNGDSGDDYIFARDGEVDTVDGGDDDNGDIAVVDSTTLTADDTTPDTVDDIVTTVEATRASGFGFGGCGGHRRGTDTSTDTGDTTTGDTTTGDTTTTTTTTTSTVSPLARRGGGGGRR